MRKNLWYLFLTFPSKKPEKKNKISDADNKNTKFTFFPFFTSLRDSTSPDMQND
jgi:hypothetical protein